MDKHGLLQFKDAQSQDHGGWQLHTTLLETPEGEEVTIHHTVLPGVRIEEVRGLSKDDYFIEKANEAKDCVTMCLPQKGGIFSNFDGIGKNLPISGDQFNMLLYPGDSSEHYVPPCGDFHFVDVHMDISYLDSLLHDDEGWKRIFREKIERRTPTMLFGTPLKVTPQVTRITREIIGCSFNGPTRRLFLEGKMMELLAYKMEIVKGNFKNDLRTVIREEDKRKLFEVKKYLEENCLRDDLSLAGICRTFGINEFKLKKGFRELFGTSVFAYLLDEKMARGKQMLADGRMNINEVADLLGYTQPGHFTMAFKKKFGMLPSAIKR